MVSVSLMVYENLTMHRPHTHDNPCTVYFWFDDILEVMDEKKKKRNQMNTSRNIVMLHTLTHLNVTIPSLHLAIIHKHPVLIGIAICGTNRIIIVRTLAFTINILWCTNCLIGFRCHQHSNTCQNHCNHLNEKQKETKKKHT